MAVHCHSRAQMYNLPYDHTVDSRKSIPHKLTVITQIRPDDIQFNLYSKKTNCSMVHHFKII